MEVKKFKSESIDQEPNPLIHGLDESYSESYADMKKKEPLFYRKTLVYTTNPFSTTSAKSNAVGTKRKYTESLLKKMYTKKLYAQVNSINSSNSEKGEVNSALMKLPRNDLNMLKFKNLGEVLPYIFKRMPLVVDNVEVSFPFTASSLDEYNSWDVSVQAYAEVRY